MLKHLNIYDLTIRSVQYIYVIFLRRYIVRQACSEVNISQKTLHETNYMNVTFPAEHYLKHS